MNRIIYLSNEILNESLYKNYFMESLLKKYSIDFITLSDVKIKKTKPIYHKINQFNFNSLDDLVNNPKLFKNISSIIFLFLPNNLFNKKIYLFFSKHKSLKIYFHWGIYPRLPFSSPRLHFLNYIFLYTPIYFFLLKLKNFYCFDRYHIDILFLAGSKNLLNKYLLPKKIVNINSFDYEKTIFTEKPRRIIDKKYAVFIDVNMINHPDAYLLGFNSINKKKYYTNILNLFKIIENQFRLNVVIAAHPSTKLSDFSADIKRNFKIYFNLTKNLIYDSSLVLNHHSTAISYAVIYNKPIIFIYNDDISKKFSSNIYRTILGQAYTLNSMKINLSKPYKLNNSIFNINKTAYKNFYNNYLVSKSNYSECNLDVFLKNIQK